MLDKRSGLPLAHPALVFQLAPRRADVLWPEHLFLAGIPGMNLSDGAADAIGRRGRAGTSAAPDPMCVLLFGLPLILRPPDLAQ